MTAFRSLNDHCGSELLQPFSLLKVQLLKWFQMFQEPIVIINLITQILDVGHGPQNIIRLFCPQRQHTSADETIVWLWFVMTFHHPFFYLSYVTVYICFTATFLPPLVTAGTLSRQKILKEKMMQISRSCLLAICVLLLHVTSSFSYNLNSKIMNIATKRLAAAAIVAVGLTGLPDQLFSFSSSSVAVAAAQDVKSIFDGMYSDPNHPGCMVSLQS